MQPERADMSERYSVTAKMLGGAANGARATCVVSDGPDPYSTDNKAQAERIADELRRLPEGYSDVRIEQVDHA